MSSDVQPRSNEALRKASGYLFALIVFLVGTLIALWMGAGRALVGAGGDFMPWYLASMTLVFVVLQALISWRLLVAVKLGFPIRPRTVVFIVLSWALGIAFGFLVPDMVDGTLVSAFSLLVDPAGADPTIIEFAIGFSNPLGIISIGVSAAALIIAWMDSKHKKLPSRNPYEVRD